MRFRGSDPHTLAGAYAMDAVSEPDRAQFERHLSRCDSCRQEVRGLREATAALATATAVEPPVALREAALRAAGQTRQMPPAATAGVPGGWGGWGGWAGRARRDGRAGGPRRRGLGYPAGWPGPGRRLGWRPRLAAALACALAAVAVAAGVMTYGMQHRLDQAQRRDLTVAAVMNASDATMMSAHVSTGGTATVVMSHRDRALVFTAADLRVLPGTEAYEIWLVGPGGTRPAGMITVARRGQMVGPMVVSGLSSGDQVGLTVEPTGGASRPTSSPVLMLPLSSS